MLFAQHLFFELQGFFIQRLGFSVSALELIQYRQVVDDCQGIRVLFAQYLFSELQGLFIQRLGLSVSALGLIQPGQVVDDC